MFTGYMIAKSRRLVKLSEDGKTFYGAYDDAGHRWKEEWLKTGRSVLKTLGKELGFDDMRVSVNKAGIAVAGDVTLMGIWNDRDVLRRETEGWCGIYLDLASPNMMYGSYNGVEPPAFMWRLIKHMRDFTGGRNRWLSYQQFNDPDNLVLTLKGMTGVPWL